MTGKHLVHALIIGVDSCSLDQVKGLVELGNEVMGI